MIAYFSERDPKALPYTERLVIEYQAQPPQLKEGPSAHIVTLIKEGQE
jgi:hypothetical protein